MHAFQVEGLDCASCARKVEAALKEVPGVVGVQVSYASGKAYLPWREKAPSRRPRPASGPSATGFARSGKGGFPGPGPGPWEAGGSSFWPSSWILSFLWAPGPTPSPLRWGFSPWP